jgi:hypothetical protein
MSIRIRRPATDRLELTAGDYLIVKQDLTAGEYRQMMGASIKPVMTAGGTPTLELDPIAAGVAMVVAYLLEWSFTDADGRPIAIADQPSAVVRAALDHIDSEAYMEVQKAIQQHVADRTAALAEEKKTRPGPPAPDRTLMSVG